MFVDHVESAPLYCNIMGLPPPISHMPWCACLWLQTARCPVNRMLLEVAGRLGLRPRDDPGWISEVTVATCVSLIDVRYYSHRSGGDSVVNCYCLPLEEGRHT